MKDKSVINVGLSPFYRNLAICRNYSGRRIRIRKRNDGIQQNTIYLLYYGLFQSLLRSSNKYNDQYAIKLNSIYNVIMNLKAKYSNYVVKLIIGAVCVL